MLTIREALLRRHPGSLSQLLFQHSNPSHHTHASRVTKHTRYHNGFLLYDEHDSRRGRRGRHAGPEPRHQGQRHPPFPAHTFSPQQVRRVQKIVK